MKFLGLKRAEQIVQLFLLLNTNFTYKHFLFLEMFFVCLSQSL